MEITLNSEIRRYIDEQVRAGRFASAQEMLEAGIARLMLDPEPDELDEADLAAIDESEAQIAHGDDMDWKEVSAGLRKRYPKE